ncbi:hypothetical protein TNCV_1851611 [Trichonephila clavipes]|nr:hypothetical protein TNCV_1851611 [Trichonephila clavipes]
MSSPAFEPLPYGTAVSVALTTIPALATELTSTLSSLLRNRLRLGNGQPTNRHETGTSRIATERYEDTFASAYTM